MNWFYRKLDDHIRGKTLWAYDERDLKKDIIMSFSTSEKNGFIWLFYNDDS